MTPEQIQSMNDAASRYASEEAMKINRAIAAEREACAKALEDVFYGADAPKDRYFDYGWNECLKAGAAAIRARSNGPSTPSTAAAGESAHSP